MAATPYNTTVTIDGIDIHAFSCVAGIATPTDGHGMPVVGSLATIFEFCVDIHDQTAMPFANVKKLFDLCNGVTREKVKPLKITFWTDDGRHDAVLTLSFEGWLSSWTVTSGGGKNHILSVTVQPKLDEKQFNKIDLGN